MCASPSGFRFKEEALCEGEAGEELLEGWTCWRSWGVHCGGVVFGSGVDCRCWKWEGRKGIGYGGRAGDGVR